MKYYIKVFGCQMNYSDAERITTYLEKNKFKPTASLDAADLIIYVTCGVRQSAEDRVYGQINNIRKKYAEKNIVLTGCLANRKDVQRRIKNKVDLFCDIKSFTNEIKKVLNTKYQIPDTKPESCYNYLKINPRYTSRHTAYVPIMTGCDNFCSYCVVPHARGREYSRPAEDILKEVRSLVKKGYKEIILLGQNVNSYNPKLNHLKLVQNSKFKIQNFSEINFTKLLKLIETKIGGKYWISFLTSHPKGMSDELINVIAKSKKVCEYISLPAQSGDNEILRRMNRKYSVEHYKKLILNLKLSFRKIESLALDKLPPAISTDIIVGFPGETKKQFENTAKLLREMKFDMAYISQYSPRPETAAWHMKDNVSKKEKARREKVLTEILAKTALANNKKYVGKIVEVLVDRRFDVEEFRKGSTLRNSKSLALGRKRSNLGQNKYHAHTRTQKKVIFYSDPAYRQSGKTITVGDFAKVRITKAKAFGLEGEIIL